MKKIMLLIAVIGLSAICGATQMFPPTGDGIAADSTEAVYSVATKAAMTNHDGNGNNSVLSSVMLFIQNVTIDFPTDFIAPRIRVGSTVTDAQPYGPVVFTGTSVTLTADTVELHGETVVELGTNFSIEPN